MPTLAVTEVLSGFTRFLPRRLRPVLPGLLLTLVVTIAAELLERLEVLLFGRAWIEALVLAIIVGTLWRTFSPPAASCDAGIRFSARTLLEIAVVLLGASISTAAIAAAGPLLIAGIAGIVAIAILFSYGIGRGFGLGHRVAVLVACGNSICGNSAIAAVAPVIGADGKEVAASIAFTAVLGVIVVLGLPALGGALALSHSQYGIFAGLTVYAVPQVIAATAPVAALAVHLGTLVKLVRVLMLGPVILAVALASHHPERAKPRLGQLVPWFIVGFLALMALRSADFIPHPALPPMAWAASLLTIVSMAALGLGVDIRAVTRSGGRVVAAASLSLVVLGGLAFLLLRVLQIA